MLYRLGGDLLIRLPRRPGKSLDANLTHGVLSRLAPFLPVAIPALIAEGRPAAEYPASWGVLRWLDGDTPVEGHLTQPGPLAADLAGFLRALWRIDLSKFGLAGGPPAYRGGALPTQSWPTTPATPSARSLPTTMESATSTLSEPASAPPGEPAERRYLAPGAVRARLYRMISSNWAGAASSTSAPSACRVRTRTFSPL